MHEMIDRTDEAFQELLVYSILRFAKYYFALVFILSAFSRLLEKKQLVEANNLVGKVVGYLETSTLADFSDNLQVCDTQSIKTSQNLALVNFCQLVIHACSRSAPDSFELLKKRYLTRLSGRSQEAFHLVAKLYYPVQKTTMRMPPMNMNAMMNSVMNMFGQASPTNAPPDID